MNRKNACVKKYLNRDISPNWLLKHKWWELWY